MKIATRLWLSATLGVPRRTATGFWHARGARDRRGPGLLRGAPGVRIPRPPGPSRRASCRAPAPQRRAGSWFPPREPASARGRRARLLPFVPRRIGPDRESRRRADRGRSGALEGFEVAGEDLRPLIRIGVQRYRSRVTRGAAAGRRWCGGAPVQGSAPNRVAKEKGRSCERNISEPWACGCSARSGSRRARAAVRTRAATAARRRAEVRAARAARRSPAARAAPAGSERAARAAPVARPAPAAPRSSPPTAPT